MLMRLVKTMVFYARTYSKPTTILQNKDRNCPRPSAYNHINLTGRSNFFLNLITLV